MSTEIVRSWRGRRWVSFSAQWIYPLEKRKTEIKVYHVVDDRSTRLMFFLLVALNDFLGVCSVVEAGEIDASTAGGSG